MAYQISVSAVDNTQNLGTSSNRYALGSALVWDVFANSGDANPAAQLTSTALRFGAGASAALDVYFRRSASQTVTLDTDGAGGALSGGLVLKGPFNVGGAVSPASDNSVAIGTSSLRISSSYAVAYNVYAAAGDAQPSARLTSNLLSLGVGGSTGVDVLFKSLGSNKPALLNGSSAAIATMADASTVQPLAYDTATGQVGPTTAFGKIVVTSVKTTTYTTAYGEYVRCDPSSAGFTVTLPAAAAASVGQQIVVKNTTSSTNTITVSRAGSDTIDTGTTATIVSPYGATIFTCTSATTWNIS